jgi:ADP-ribose pyrophosphatase YjhB (NUDIX family)
MQPADLELLVRLLEQLRAEGLGVPHMPFEVLRTFRGLVMQTAVEVLLTNAEGAFLLTWRSDDFWHGWHIPGGYVAPEETTEAACRRIARRELGVDVTLRKLAGAYTWTDHPYASMISIVCQCDCGQAPSDGRYFAAIPDGVLPNHRPFLEAFLRGETFAG